MDHSTGGEFYKCSQPIVASHVIGCPGAMWRT
jgi:hypothetical protein